MFPPCSIRGQELQRRSVTAVFGAGQSGKTSFVIRWLLNAPALRCRFVFDPDGEFSARLRLPAQNTVLHMEVGIRRGWCVFDPTAIFAGNTEAALAFFCDLALQFSAALPGRKVLIVDEVWRHCNPRSIPSELLNVIKTGRKAGLGSVFITQEPREMPETILAEATELVSFRLDGLNPLGRLADYSFPDQATLPALVRGQFVAWNKLSGGKLRGRLF